MVSDLNIFVQKWSKVAPPKKSFKKNYLCSLHLNVFLPPLPEVQCPNFLDFPNPWGKNNGKNGFHIWIPLLIKGKKSPRKKKVRFSTNFALLAGFFWYRCYYLHLSRDSLSPVCGIFTKQKNTFY